MAKLNVWCIDPYIGELDLIRRVFSCRLRGAKVEAYGSYIIHLIKLKCGILPDVIILDYYFNRNPLYLEFIKIIKKARCLGKLKIIVLSAMGIEKYSHLQNSLDGYFQKPCLISEIAETITRNPPKIRKSKQKFYLELILFPSISLKVKFFQKILMVWQDFLLSLIGVRQEMSCRMLIFLYLRVA